MSSEKRVLHLLWTGSIGGAQRAVFQLVRAQIEMSNFRPAVAFAVSTGPYFEMVSSLGCEVIDLGLRRDRGVYKAFGLSALMEGYHIHHFHSAELTMALSSIRCKNVRRVYTHRGGLADYGPKQKLRYMIAGYLLRHYFHAYSGNTQHASISAARLYGIDADNWRVTYNGLDFALLAPKRPSSVVADELLLPTHPCLTVGTSAQLRPWKRIDLLFRACAALPAESVRVVVIGDGPDRSRLQLVAQNLGVASRTWFVGMKEHVGDYLPLVDVFVLPSMGLESFGNAAVEAMALGKPTIVFNDGGGLLEHIVNGDTGFVVSSVSELTATLNRLMKDKSLRENVGRRGSEFVRSRYTLRQMVEGYDALYELSLSKSGVRV